MISLRIPSELENRLNSLAKTVGKSRSEIIKQSIQEYIQRHESSMYPYKVGQDLFGVSEKEQVAPTDLAQNRKLYLKKQLAAKHSRSK